MVHELPDEAPHLQTFGPDKILSPKHAEHVRGVIIRTINRHADLGIVRERIADAATEALTGKVMRPDVTGSPSGSSGLDRAADTVLDEFTNSGAD